MNAPEKVRPPQPRNIGVNFSRDLQLLLFHGEQVIPIQLSMDASTELAATILAAVQYQRELAERLAANN